MRKVTIYITSTTAISIALIPSELKMNEEFTMEMMDVRTQVENKHESRNRKALSWITRKRWREVASRKKSAITSAVNSFKWMAMVDISGFYSQTNLTMAICRFNWQRVCCGSQTQNTWPIKTAGSTRNKTTMAERGRLCCFKLGLIRMIVRRIERRASLSNKWIQNEYYCHIESITTHQIVE